MEALGAGMARRLRPGMVIYFHGSLGAGKTTCVRGLLHGLGHRGAVKSPTYTLVEPYELGGRAVYHFDLYRMKSAEELEFLGMRDYLEQHGVCLVEWPERGAGVLPPPDVDVSIEQSEDGRIVQLTSHSENGAALLGGLS